MCVCVCVCGNTEQTRHENLRRRSGNDRKRMIIDRADHERVKPRHFVLGAWDTEIAGDEVTSLFRGIEFVRVLAHQPALY